MGIAIRIQIYQIQYWCKIKIHNKQVHFMKNKDVEVYLFQDTFFTHYNGVKRYKE